LRGRRAARPLPGCLTPVTWTTNLDTAARADPTGFRPDRTTHWTWRLPHRIDGGALGERWWSPWETETGPVRKQPLTVPGMMAAGGPPVVEATLGQLTERARALVASCEWRILVFPMTAARRSVDA
jgi:hypothetical protein